MILLDQKAGPRAEIISCATPSCIWVWLLAVALESNAETTVQRVNRRQQFEPKKRSKFVTNMGPSGLRHPLKNRYGKPLHNPIHAPILDCTVPDKHLS